MRLLPILLSLAWGAAAFADDQRARSQSIDPAIWHVEAAGIWEHARQSGHYRAVTYKRCSPEHCYDTLFIEWLASGEAPRVVATKQVMEVGDLTVMSEVRFVLSKAGTRLQIKHQTGAGKDRWVKCLRLGTPGKYTVQDRGCGKAG